MSLHPDHLVDLQKSGLSNETITQAGLYSVCPGDIPKILGWDPKKVDSALAFPYSGTDFIRLKVFPSYEDKNGRKVKYLQRSGTSPQLYIPPMVTKFVKDPTVPLNITEGEKKALKACQTEMTCIAVAGLWSWVSDGKPIANLDDIAWTKRDVRIFPDSDVWSRSDLLQAVYALGKELEWRGAQVQIGILPGGDDPKVGLDDYLQKEGLMGLKKLHLVKLKDQSFKEISEWWSIWKRRQSVHEQSVPMTDEEREQAIALLRRKDLLLQFVKDIAELGCVGEEENKLILKLSLTSRLLKDPINVTVKGESSAGKNFLVNSAIQFLPPETIKFISAATPKALFYLPDDLSHKVLVIAEAPGAQDADYSIRTLQSEGEIVILVPEKDKSTGRIETKERKVKGPVTFILTTTKPHLHPENETRTFDIFIDDGQEQTQAIFKAQNKKYLGVVDTKKIDNVLKVWRNAHRLLKPLPVLIPYVEEIEFPNQPLRVRRDRPRFLALIEASTLLHQFQRERKEIDGQPYLIASLDDYEVVRQLASRVLSQVLKGATPKCEELVERAGEFGESEFTRTELEARLGWNRKTVTKYVLEALDLGCLDDVTPKGTKAYKYKFVKTVAEMDCLLLARQELEQKLSNPSTLGDSQVGQIN